jgi:hypothetical protein
MHGGFIIVKKYFISRVFLLSRRYCSPKYDGRISTSGAVVPIFWNNLIIRDTLEYVIGVDKFINCATENMRQIRARTIIYPCRNC